MGDLAVHLGQGGGAVVSGEAEGRGPESRGWGLEGRGVGGE